VADAGATAVLYASGQALTAVGNSIWSQDSPGLAGGTEPGEPLVAHFLRGM